MKAVAKDAILIISVLFVLINDRLPRTRGDGLAGRKKLPIASRLSVDLDVAAMHAATMDSINSASRSIASWPRSPTS